MRNQIYFISILIAMVVEKGCRQASSAFVGGFAVASMCNNQTISDAFGDEMGSGRLDDCHWFTLSMRTLYLLPLTGNFWKPVVSDK